jgi:asparagine synthase (glutamine-hydrolysing)
VDSGSVFLVLHHLLLARGQAPARLKAFTLAVDGQAADLQQSREFLGQLDLTMFLETINVPLSALDYQEAIRVIEDYKQLDVESATMALALCRGIRARYPDWKYLVDGDGGDENLKDYPIEENPELTINSVVNNRLLYQEGWGWDIKHSPIPVARVVGTRGPTRRACAGFQGFSPYTLPMIAVAEEFHLSS